jgi:Holliday junction resolvase RusA-like endonuclease
MINEIYFTVHAVPVAQPRQRHRVIATKSGKSFVHNYTPKTDPVNTFKAACCLAAKEAFGDRGPIEGPIIMDLMFVMPRPKSMPRRLVGRQPHAKKPDRDNLAKSVQDALEGLLYANDSQLFRGEIQKWIAAEHETPHVWVKMAWF